MTFCKRIENFEDFFFLVLAAWLKGRTNREKQVFSELFEQSFLAIFTWGTQNCEFMMEVLQCNIIQQVLYVLDGLIPYSKDVEQAATQSIAGSTEGEKKMFFFVPFSVLTFIYPLIIIVHHTYYLYTVCVIFYNIKLSCSTFFFQLAYNRCFRTTYSHS